MNKLPQKLPIGTIMIAIPDTCKECEWLLYDCSPTHNCTKMSMASMGLMAAGQAR